MRFRPLKAIGLSIVVLLLVVGAATASTLTPQTALPGKCVPMFAVPLPVFGPAGAPRVNGAAHPALTVRMKEVDQAVLPQKEHDTCGKGVTFGKTKVWAYEYSDSFTNTLLAPASWPAATLEALRNSPLIVTYVNTLPANGVVQRLLTIDQTLHWADPLGAMCMDNPLCTNPFVGPVPTVPHLHGAEVPSSFDGNPEAWFTPSGQHGSAYRSLVPVGAGKAVYLYNNTQEPGTLWFHDHALGSTRTNVYSGLAAFYLVRDAAHEPANLPSGANEFEIVLQDREFDTNSQLFFPDGSGTDVDTSNLNGPPTNPDVHPFWSPEFIGDVITVNGAPWPYMNIEPRRYRIRVLDGSNARVYRLSFGAAKVYQIGNDDNYLDAPVPVSQIFIAPGERADLIVDFSGLNGQKIVVTNDAPVPFPDGLLPGDPLQENVGSIMQFRVGSKSVRDESCNPLVQCRRPSAIAHLTDGKGHLAAGVKIDKVRRLALKEHEGPGGPLEVLLNNTKWDGSNSPTIARQFPDGISETPRVGSTELWEILNLTGDAHPIHTHLAQFQILNREDFDVDGSFTKAGGGHGYIGVEMDDPLQSIPGVWANAFKNASGPLCDRADNLNPCPGYGPPMPYDEGETISLENGQIVPLVGGNPAIEPFLLHKATPPSANEAGWKDTAKANPGQVMRIVIRWAPTSTQTGATRAGQNLYPFDPTSGPGYVWHCHILDHEDNEMMRPYTVGR